MFAGVFAMAACGGDDGGTRDGARNIFTAPSSSVTTKARPTVGTERTLAGARDALQAFLHGQAAGDISVCRYVAPGSDFVKGPALRGDCVKGVRSSPHSLRPQERDALATISISGGRLNGDKAIVPFSSLKWRLGHLVIASVQSRYVLRWQNGIWQIIR
ncbi:hypothetical protein SMC26_36510 [Actinomadura fulvescens]|uniref:hypothetical protein n=1 Tax=Actinomadura fulvescens TaxID=46160 RepID=UPI0031CE42C2